MMLVRSAHAPGDQMGRGITEPWRYGPVLWRLSAGVGVVSRVVLCLVLRDAVREDWDLLFRDAGWPRAYVVSVEGPCVRVMRGGGRWKWKDGGTSVWLIVKCRGVVSGASDGLLVGFADSPFINHRGRLERRWGCARVTGGSCGPHFTY